ncbi:MAG: TlpA family protein disulfide reductase [Thermoleophilia bacterium]|nr:TlpA family protein disulfide reductase [Thermoleophilia bacterium]MDH3724686.1 TlpA family protein disulfide reductase [Thermoleophilia bacterium]
MSQKTMVIIGGAIAVIVVGGLIIFGLAQSGDKVGESAAVPGDDAAQASTEARVASAEGPAKEPAGDASEPLPKGPDLPAFTGTDLQTGGSINIQDAVAGKPLVIQMWASWCEVCNETAGDVKRFIEDRPDINYLGIDVQDDAGAGRGFYEEHGWTHQSIFDNGTLAQAFGLRGTPTYIFVHPDGKIAGQTIGDPGYEGLNRIADRLLASS